MLKIINAKLKEEKIPRGRLLKILTKVKSVPNYRSRAAKYLEQILNIYQYLFPIFAITLLLMFTDLKSGLVKVLALAMRKTSRTRKIHIQAIVY